MKSVVNIARHARYSALLLITLASCYEVFGQNITQAEYFIDVDPGTGNGVSIPGVTAGPSVILTNLVFPTNGLPVGAHTVHVRTRDTNGIWGFYESRRFFIRDAIIPPPPPDPTVPIVAMEYYYDTVTEPGTGIPISVATGFAPEVINENMPNSLTEGWHTLHVRTKNQNNVWGFYDSRRVFVRGPIAPLPPIPPISPIVAVEYFYDDVTAPGTGTSISVTTGFTPEVVNEIMPSSLPVGWHTVHVRVKNQDNIWGFHESRRMFVKGATTITPPDPPSPVVLFEYFLDTDLGAGLNSRTISKPPSTLIELTNELIDVGLPTLGNHTIGIRAKNGKDIWGMAAVATFTVLPACPISTSPVANNASRCDAGSVVLSASGATGSQVYRWYADNTTYTVLFTGANYSTPSLTVNTNYFVSIYDPATFCESTRTQVTAIVTGLPKPTLNLTGSLQACEGSSVSLTAPAGFSTYMWSNGLTTQTITVNISGSFTVIVGNGSCLSPASDPFTYSINPRPSKPVITATGGGSLCGSGSVTLSAPAGFTSYSWSSGQSTQDITVNSIGTFTVMVTNSNGCQSLPSDVFSVTSSTLAKPIISFSGTTICNAGTITLTAPAGFTSYAWSTGETTSAISAPAGSYTVSVSNGSCLSPLSDPVTITLVSSPAKPVSDWKYGSMY
ncbi:hypothetical protein BH09BAC3_BH09BAC3_30710 [soil metagenome]